MAQMRWADAGGIDNIKTSDTLPQIASSLGGFKLWLVLRGRFRLRPGQDADIFVNRGTPPYIVVATPKRDLSFSARDPTQTMIMSWSLRPLR